MVKHLLDTALFMALPLPHFSFFLCIYHLGKMATFSDPDWEKRMDNYATKWSNEDRTHIALDEYFFSLKNILIKNSHLHWHAHYLGIYVNDKVCPLGLRIQLFPNFRIDDDTFKTKWEDGLTSCSLSLLQLLIDHYKDDLGSVDREVSTLLSTRAHLRENPEFTRR